MIGVFFVVLQPSDVFLTIFRFALSELLGALRPSLLAIRAAFRTRVRLGTPSRALAAFALTLSLAALDVESSVAFGLLLRTGNVF